MRGNDGDEAEALHTPALPPISVQERNTYDAIFMEQRERIAPACTDGIEAAAAIELLLAHCSTCSREQASRLVHLVMDAMSSDIASGRLVNGVASPQPPLSLPSSSASSALRWCSREQRRFVDAPCFRVAMHLARHAPRIRHVSCGLVRRERSTPSEIFSGGVAVRDLERALRRGGYHCARRDYDDDDYDDDDGAEEEEKQDERRRRRR